MPLTMAKADGVTVLTLTSDSQSACPPLCQILKALCYSPICCSLSQQLKKVQRTSQSVLGALHIMIGLLNIGVGAIVFTDMHIPWWQIQENGAPFWLGGLFIFLGIMSILSEKYPSPCLVILNAILNIAGVAFAIAAIVLYSIGIGAIWLQWVCDPYYYSSYTPTTSPRETIIKEKCMEAVALTRMLIRGFYILMVVFSTMEMCVAISSAVLGIKALCRKPEKQTTEDLEQYKPLLEEVTSDPVV